MLKTTRIWRTENLIDFLLKDLEKRVKRDKATKLSVFFAGLSAYLPEPINLFLKGESGIGKSYNVVETLKYFPIEEDVWFLGGLSPKALIHDYGVLLNKYGDPIDLDEKPVKPLKKHCNSEEDYKEAIERYKEERKAWREELRNCYTLVDLSHKILVFLESPEFQTFRMLFPILSHDKERIEYKFTDKTARGQLRTSKVVIQGWPATIFLSTDRKYIEELATRSFTATPEASKDKIEEANKLTNLKACFPWQYDHETKETETIRKLIHSLRNHLVESNYDVAIPFTNLHELFPREIVRDMRDFQHFTQFLKTVTALHFFQRVLMECNGKKFILSTVKDVQKALRVYMEVFETTRTGTEHRLLKFYHDIVKTKVEWYLKDLTFAYNKEHKEKKLSSETIRKWLQRLCEIGYVDVEKDGKLNVYKPLVEQEEISTFRQILEKPTSLSSKLENGFKSWLKNILNTTSFYYYKNFDRERWGEDEISMEDAEKVILQGENFSLILDESILRTPFNLDSELKTDKKPKEIGFSEKREFLEISSEPLFQCQICRQSGKPVFFANEHDLQLHTERLHNNNPDYGID